jgi:alkylation response protein AidB-like acyl-CoA dehydrogenase
MSVDLITDIGNAQPARGENAALVRGEARVQELVQRVAPALRASRGASEAARRLAPEAMEALIGAGIMRALIPAVYHGSELGPVYGVKLFEELAYIDSAAAWVGAINAAAAWLIGMLPSQAGDEIVTDARSVVNGSLFPPLTAEHAPGGYRVTGRSAFASGCDYATWLQCQAAVLENGAPKIGANGLPVSLLVHVPASQAEIIDTWNTLGMRGTGSNDFRVSDVFVPEHRVWRMGPVAPANPAFRDGLTRMGIWWFSPLVASVSLGIARAAIADLGRTGAAEDAELHLRRSCRQGRGPGQVGPGVGQCGCRAKLPL